ncbi:MAG: phosphotransferase [Spirochaetaceae bacterium]|nr:phosphotransferase [Spirochaetaceae bacterium]
MKNGMEEKLIQLLQTQYRLENISLEFLREGGCKTYIVNCGKKYLLKVIGNAFKDTAKQSVLITRFLEESGFPVPKTILTESGEAIVELSADEEACLILMQEFIEGEEPNLEEAETAGKVGALVGKLHSLMEHCPVQPVFRDKDFFIGRYIDFLCQKSYPKIAEYEKLGERLWKKVEKLPYGICHGDLHRGNLLQTKNGQIYLLDFDTVCKAPLMFDVMVICDMTNYFNLQEKDIETTRAVYENFISGYTHCHPLSPEEKLTFSDWVAIRHFQLQATILEVHGINCIDEQFIDWQLYWLNEWMENKLWNTEKQKTMI